jgi:hypothetical protein
VAVAVVTSPGVWLAGIVADCFPQEVTNNNIETAIMLVT